MHDPYMDKLTEAAQAVATIAMTGQVRNFKQKDE
jgi:hypothetical protein